MSKEIKCPHERGHVIACVAKALCQFAYPTRSLDESVSPGLVLWMRLIPEAEIAVRAMESRPSGPSGGDKNAAPQVSAASGRAGEGREVGPLPAVAAPTNYAELLSALKDLAAMYSHAWDREDGALIMMGSSVQYFERCHAKALRAIEKSSPPATTGGNK